MKTKISGTTILTIVLSSVVVLAIIASAVFFFGSKGSKEFREFCDTAFALAQSDQGIVFAQNKLEPFSGVVTVQDENGKTDSDEFSNEQAKTELVLTSFDKELVFPRSPEKTAITVHQGETEIFSGTLESFGEFLPQPDSDYVIHINTIFNSETYTAEYTYEFAVKYDVRPELYISKTTVSQGDVLLFCADNITDPENLSVSVEFPYEPKLEKTDKGYCAYIPINYMRTEGGYVLTAVYNGETTTYDFSVTEPEYDVQHLTVSGSTASATIGNNTAVETYNNTMARLNEMFDETIYWSERFIQPVEGTLTTEFGIKRYTNNAETPSRHAGIDIAADEGTPVKASNNGKVIFADYLQVSGNTVVIEHGMGLHSLYLHMDSLAVSVGDMVKLGDTVGAVGMTGFATGPHLHFQLMVNSMTISPWYAFDGSSGIYEIQKHIQ